MGKDADPNILNKAVFKILKPGGDLYDHRPCGQGRAGAWRDTEKLHRIDPATVRSKSRRRASSSPARARCSTIPADPLDIPVFDKSIRGHTSQFAYKFVKPN